MNQTDLDMIALAGQRYGDIKVWALPLHGIAVFFANTCGKTRGIL
jgi:hypothetical protein